MNLHSTHRSDSEAARVAAELRTQGMRTRVTRFNSGTSRNQRMRWSVWYEEKPAAVRAARMAQADRCQPWGGEE